MDVNQYLEIFLDETKEHLESLNAQILNLEQSPEDSDTINEIFRAMHTIKGSSGVMMFDEITRISHKLEDVFYYLRESKPDNVPHIELVEHVLQVVDFISSEMIKIENGQQPDGSASDYVAALDAFLNKIKNGDGEQQNLYYIPEGFTACQCTCLQGSVCVKRISVRFTSLSGRYHFG